MTMTDPIADMLTRIRNANVAMHDEVTMPSSKQKVALAELLTKEGYLSSYREADNDDRPTAPRKTGVGRSGESRQLWLLYRGHSTQCR